MTTARQIAANRRNAQLSTGPKTAAGKDIVKINALKHGLLAASPLLPDEDSEEYDSFRQAVFEELQPVGAMEAILVVRLVSLAWRLHRLACVETGIISHDYHDRIAERAKRKAESLEVVQELYLQDEEWVEKTVRTITDKEAHEYALREQQWAENVRDNTTGKAAGAFLSDSGAGLERLHRYEVGLEKSYYKALREIQRLQTARIGNNLVEERTTQIVAIATHRSGRTE